MMKYTFLLTMSASVLLATNVYSTESCTTDCLATSTTSTTSTSSPSPSSTLTTTSANPDSTFTGNPAFTSTPATTSSSTNISTSNLNPSSTTTSTLTGTKSHYAEIHTKELQDLIKSGKSMTIIDARAGKYDDGKRIPGAKQLTDQATAEEVAMMIPEKNQLIAVYCANLKCPASKWMADYLLSLGYTNVLKYPEGIEAWISAGNKVEMAK